MLLTFASTGCSPNSPTSASLSPGSTPTATATTAITLEGFETFDASGPLGGPFDGTQTYRINNVSEEPLRWEFDASVDWLSVEPTWGLLAGGGSIEVEVRVDDERAASLDSGLHTGSIVLREDLLNSSYPINARLSILPPTIQPFDVAPEEGVRIVSAIDALGSVQPTPLIVSNFGPVALPWNAAVTEPWITLQLPNPMRVDPGMSQNAYVGIVPSLVSQLGVGIHTGLIRLRESWRGHIVDIPVVVRVTPATGGGRVTAGLIAEYDFSEAAGSVVHDRSGLLPALDLTVENPGATTWYPGSLSLNSPTILTTAGPATRLIEECRGTDEITVEAWITPANVIQDGPARIVGISDGASTRNFTLGQGQWAGLPSQTYNMRLRTSETDLDGMPMLGTPNGAANAALQHVLYTRAANGTARLYVDGQVVSSSSVGGNLDNWASSYKLAVGGEIGESRPWLGQLHHIAIYRRALDSSEVSQNFQAGSGSSNAGHLAITPASQVQFVMTTGIPSTQTHQYTLTNVGGEPLDWRASTSESWLIGGPTAGSLAPGGAALVTVRLNASIVGGFAAGSYQAQLDIVNETNGFGSASRSAQLLVSAPGSGGSGSKPGPHNTGPTNPGLLTTMGGITITTPGQVLENVFINGPVVIKADNVVLRNFIVDAGGLAYGIRMTDDKHGILLEDGEVRNVSSSCLYGTGFTARRLNVHESGGDGFKAVGDTVVESCWIHHIGTNPNAHADGDQTRWGSNLVFRYNNFDLPYNVGGGYTSNAALIIQTGAGPIDDVLVEDNWLNGGNFTVYFTDKGVGFGQPTNCRLINNRFGRDYQFGVLQTTGTVYVSGNRWEDTGELMSINNH